MSCDFRLVYLDCQLCGCLRIERMNRIGQNVKLSEAFEVFSTLSCGLITKTLFCFIQPNWRKDYFYHGT